MAAHIDKSGHQSTARDDRLAVALDWSDSSASAATTLAWLNAAHARNTTDFEIEYYLGAALSLLLDHQP